MRHFYVHILASKSRVLYTGITNDIWRRVWEHKNNVFPGFTSKYRVHRLVYFETFKYADNAIKRGNQGLAAVKEDGADCGGKSNVGGLERRLVRRKKSQTNQLCASAFNSRSFPCATLRVRMTR